MFVSIIHLFGHFVHTTNDRSIDSIGPCSKLFLYPIPLQVAVPRSAVGVVIGKNGEMIKKIQNETGARVQFQQGRDDNPEERMCALTGTMNQIEDARQRIEELIESVLVVHLTMCFYFI